MAQGLSTSRVVNITTDFSPSAEAALNTNTVVILTDENVIDVKERMRYYASSADVAADFGTTSYAYLASLIWFSYKPEPQSVYIGRWARTGTSAKLGGGYLNTTQQHVTNFSTVTNGGIVFVIDGVTTTLTGLDFNGVTNLNGVASIITTALNGHATCVWTGEQFVVTSSTTGAGTAASGTITLASNPANNDTLTINGLAITFVTASPTGNQVQIGATAADTTANLLAFLLASTATQLTTESYVRTGTAIAVTYYIVGTSGNSIALAKTGTAITLSGATLTGGVAPSSIAYALPGAGEDISSLLMLTSATANLPVQGIAAESAVAAVQALDLLSTYWFAISNGTPNILQSDKLAIAAYIETTTHIFGASTVDAANTDPTSTTSTSYLMNQLGYERSFVSYHDVSPYSAMGFLAAVCTVDYTQPNSKVTAANKIIPGLTGSYLTPTQANTMDTNRCNYYAVFNNGVAITQGGKMSGPAFIDEIVDIQSLSNDLQADEFLVIQSLPSVPQSDGGMHILTTTNESTLARYGSAPSCPNGNGVLAPGNWTSDGFGALNTGDVLPTGFYVYREPISLHDPLDRLKRDAVPGTIAVHLAGAVHKDNVTVNVNR